MNGVLSASRLMTAREIRKQCKIARSNVALLLAVELEAKERLFKISRKNVA